MAKRTTGLPPFYGEVCKLLGVEDTTKGGSLSVEAAETLQAEVQKSGKPVITAQQNPCKEIEINGTKYKITGIKASEGKLILDAKIQLPAVADFVKLDDLLSVDSLKKHQPVGTFTKVKVGPPVQLPELSDNAKFFVAGKQTFELKGKIKVSGQIEQHFKTELMGSFNDDPVAVLEAELKEAKKSRSLLANEEWKTPSEEKTKLAAIKQALKGWDAKIAALQGQLANHQIMEAKQKNLEAITTVMGVPAKFLFTKSEAWDTPVFPQEPLTKEEADELKLPDYARFEVDWKNYTEKTLFTVQATAMLLYKSGTRGEKLALWITDRTPVCCPYPTEQDCIGFISLEAYFANIRFLHFEKDHTILSGDMTIEGISQALDKAAIFARAPNWGPAMAASWFNNQLPLGSDLPRLTEEIVHSKTNLLTYAAELSEKLSAYLEENLTYTSEPEYEEIVELTLTNLTTDEAEELMKTLAKTQTKQDILVHKTKRKELGSKSKAVVVWPFESNSMQVNGEPITYKTQLNQDGTISCNCMGWVMGSAKNKDGRFCKHTQAVKTEAEILYKEWKKTGTIKGENFEVVSEAAVSEATTKTLFKALKTKPQAGETTIFKATRIVEI